ncbi:hypothetical protein TRVL_00486 [Trypanosoma vivax]|nr:hypothetical protein TRVL_00486 [Trypanosoma vivax]
MEKVESVCRGVKSPAVFGLSRPSDPLATFSDRSGSTSPLTYEIDPATRRLLEENEGMLFEVNALSRELFEARETITALRNVIDENKKEIDTLRDRLGCAHVTASSASERVINYKAECERLEADNKRLQREYESVCAELNEQTESIRQDMARRGGSTECQTDTQHVELFNREMVGVLQIVDRVANLLPRCVCVIAGEGKGGRALENAEKELHNLQRLGESVRRLSSAGADRVEGMLSRVRNGEWLAVPGDWEVLIRWMIVQVFEAGRQGTEGNLRALVALLAENGSSGAASVASVGNKDNRCGNGKEIKLRPKDIVVEGTLPFSRWRQT